MDTNLDISSVAPASCSHSPPLPQTQDTPVQHVADYTKHKKLKEKKSRKEAAVSSTSKSHYL